MHKTLACFVVKWLFFTMSISSSHPGHEWWRTAFTIYSLGDFGVLQNRYIVRTPQPRLTTYLQGLHVGQA